MLARRARWYTIAWPTTLSVREQGHMMKQRRLAAPATALLVILGSVVVLAVRQQPGDSRVYTVAQVQAGLRHAPASWIGRTIRVRAMVTGIVLPVTMHSRAGAASQVSVVVALPGPYCPTASMGCGMAPKFLAPGPLTMVQLSDAAMTSPGPTLLARVQSEPSWLTLVRRIPWIGGLFAPPQTVNLLGFATYRLRLLSTSGCRQICSEAVLLDAT